MRRSKNGIPTVAILLGFTFTWAAHVKAGGIQITPFTNSVRVEINGRLFTEYHFNDAAKPYCYPLIGPGGVGMTRDWPMQDTPGEEHDHPHHRGFWFGHGGVNGNDLWTEREKTGKILHEKFTELKSGNESGTIKSRNTWVAVDGKILCTDERTLRFYNLGDAPVRAFDFEIIIYASRGDVLLGDTKEGLAGIRIAESMRLTKPTLKGEKPRPGNGRIVNSNGVRDAEAWGKHADWVDYCGPVNGKVVGIAMFDHPSNLRHPTGWHARDYGFLAANPFAAHDFEKQPEGAGDYTIPAGKSLTFRYRIYLHEGDEKQGRVAERYQEYVQTSTERAK
jgi:Methane oxygenase PmoA